MGFLYLNFFLHLQFHLKILYGNLMKVFCILDFVPVLIPVLIGVLVPVLDFFIGNNLLLKLLRTFSLTVKSNPIIVWKRMTLFFKPCVSMIQ